jgi:hypothetical protein
MEHLVATGFPEKDEGKTVPTFTLLSVLRTNADVRHEENYGAEETEIRQ